MAFIQQLQGRLNFAKNADTVITDGHHRIGCRLDDIDCDGAGLGVVQSIVEHLREAVLPDVHHIRGQGPEQITHVAQPDVTLIATAGDGKRLAPGDELG